jgi:hypothetical protein
LFAHTFIQSFITAIEIRPITTQPHSFKRIANRNFTAKMFSKCILLPALMATLAVARTDISGCTTTIIGQMAVYYVPDTGELCEFLNCGGGRAPPKTDVPGCAAYSGTATYSPQYLPNFVAKTTAAAAVSSTDAPTSAAVVAPQPTSAAAAPSTDASVQQAAAPTASAASDDHASDDSSASTDGAPAVTSAASAAGSAPAAASTSALRTGVTTSAHGNIAVTTAASAKTLTTGSRTSTAASGTKTPLAATGAASKAQFWMGGAALALGAVAVAL